MTRLGIEPGFPGPLANTLTIMLMFGTLLVTSLKSESLFVCTLLNGFKYCY